MLIRFSGINEKVQYDIDDEYHNDDIHELGYVLFDFLAKNPLAEAVTSVDDVFRFFDGIENPILLYLYLHNLISRLVTPMGDELLEEIDSLLYDDITSLDIYGLFEEIGDRKLINAWHGLKGHTDSLYSIFGDAVTFCLDSNIDDERLSTMETKRRWFIFQRMYYGHSTLPIILSAEEREDIFAEHSTVTLNQKKMFDTDYQFDEPDNIEDMIEHYRKTPIVIEQSYEVESLMGALYAEFIYMAINDHTVKKCAYCNRYFVPSAKNMEYCTRIIPSKGKTCKEYAPMYFYRERKKQGNEYMPILTKAIQSHSMRNHRNPSLYTKEQLANWRIAAEGLYEYALVSGMPADEFKARLKPNVIVIETPQM